MKQLVPFYSSPASSPGTLSGSLCARRRVGTFRTSSCHSALSASRSQKAGQLGVLCSHEPRCPAVIQFPLRAPCWRCIHLQSRIKDLSRGPILSLWFAVVVMCGRNSLGAGATSQSLKLFSVSLEGIRWVLCVARARVFSGPGFFRASSPPSMSLFLSSDEYANETPRSSQLLGHTKLRQ